MAVSNQKEVEQAAVAAASSSTAAGAVVGTADQQASAEGLLRIPAVASY